MTSGKSNDISVEILDTSLALVCVIKNLKPFSPAGDILQFSKELSDYGECKFRVDANDTILDTYGDVLQPMKYHIRIRSNATILWQGIIADNPVRNKNYIEVVGVEYEFFLEKALVTRSTADENGNSNVYRVFDSGTMATAITTIMNETKAKWQNANHPLKNITLGTIENPDYPKGMSSDYTTTTKTTLSGGWYFGTGTDASMGPTFRFDFHTILYILKAFGIQTYADFYIDNNLQFNFKKFVGNANNKNLVFRYGEQGNIIDYNLGRYGKRMVNDLYGMATDPYGLILHESIRDEQSVKEYGLMEGWEAYVDIKSQAGLVQRVNSTIKLISSPVENTATVYLNENGTPFSTYNIGDIVTVKIKNKGVDFGELRRIVGITYIINETGRQTVAVQTNKPQDFQVNG